jgi:hypothetical protein
MHFTDDVYFDSANPFKVGVASTPFERDGTPEGVKEVVYNLGQVFVDGMMYQQYPLKEEMLLNKASWWYNLTTNQVLINFDVNHQPNHSQIELTTRRRIFAPHVRGLGYIHVIGFIMEHCGNQYPRNFWEKRENGQAGALGTRSGNHWLIKNNVVRYAANIGIDCGTEGVNNEIKPQRIYKTEEVLNNCIENNYVIDNGCTGITGCGSTNLIVRGNVVMYNNNQMYRGKKRWESAGIKFHDNRNCYISENLIANNFSYGIWFDNQYLNARVSRNIIVDNSRSGIFLEMGDYDFGAVMIDHNSILNNLENQIYMHDASGALYTNNLISGSRKIIMDEANVHTGIKNSEQYGQAIYIRQVGPRTKTYHNAFYNNIICNSDIFYDINYPMWRGGEQRFLGNVYDNGATEKKFFINPTSDSPQPMSDSLFMERVAYDTGFGKDKVSGKDSKKAEMDLESWQKFWKSHSMHYDGDAQIVERIGVQYLPDTQLVFLYIKEKLSERDNSNWNFNFKMRYNLTEEKSFPGPFGEIQTGSNYYKIYSGLPSVKRGELPIPELFYIPEANP